MLREYPRGGLVVRPHGEAIYHFSGIHHADELRADAEVNGRVGKGCAQRAIVKAGALS